MFILERETFVPAARAEVFAFFSDPHNLARITPLSLGFEVLEAPPAPLRAGQQIRYRIRVLGIPLRWTSLISEWREGTCFVDEQLRGPYKRWRHEHTLRDVDGGVIMSDRVEYELPFGAIGALFGGWWVTRDLERIFEFRGKAIGAIFPART
jgi:ligand-binding SRPBCC domain-containing protein